MIREADEIARLREECEFLRESLLRLGDRVYAEPQECDLNNLDVVNIKVGPKIYFLVLDNIVVYVGKTRQPWPVRIAQHVKENTKRFDKAVCIDCRDWALEEIESALIYRLAPRYNSQTEHPARYDLHTCMCTLAAVYYDAGCKSSEYNGGAK